MKYCLILLLALITLNASAQAPTLPLPSISGSGGITVSDTTANRVVTQTFANANYKEIYSGATLPASATIYQTGNKFLLTTDSTEYTYQGNHVWFSNIVKGNTTPLQRVTSGTETFDNSRAVWKNPNINIFGKTVDYTYQNTTWQPQKKFIDVADYGAIAGSGVSTLIRSNNTQAIQAAFNVISATGGQLIISDLYDIDSLELQNSNAANFSEISITGKTIGGSGLNVYGTGVGIGMEGRNYLKWSNMTINFVATPQVGFLLCRTSFSPNCNNNWFSNMIIGGSASISTFVTLSSESMRFNGMKIINGDVNGGACFATSNGLTFGIADTSTIITSSNTDIVFNSCEMYHATSNARVIRLSTSADIKFYGCSFIVGDQLNSSIAEFSSTGNIFDGTVLFDGCLFEASRAPFLFINTNSPNYWKNINVRNCYVNDYGTNGSGVYKDVVQEIGSGFGFFYNFNWEANRFSYVNPKLKLGNIFDSKIYHHTENATFECVLAGNCNIDVITITNTPTYILNTVVKTNTNVSFDKINLDASKTTGNPIIAKGLLQGLITDSIVTDSAGIFRRQSIIGLTSTYNNVPYSSVAFGDNVPLTTTNGFNMVLIGSYAGTSLLANQTNNNTLVGAKAGYNLTNTGSNTFIGSQAGYYNTGTSSIILGNFSGKYTTYSNKLLFNSLDRTSALGDSTYSIINGTMDSSVVNQKLRFNAATITMPYLPKGAATDSIVSDSAGILRRYGLIGNYVDQTANLVTITSNDTVITQKAVGASWVIQKSSAADLVNAGVNKKLPQGSLTVTTAGTTQTVVITNGITPSITTDITHINLWNQVGGTGVKVLLIPTVDFTLTSISGNNITIVLTVASVVADKLYILIK